MNPFAGLGQTEKPAPRRYFKAPKVENPWGLSGASMRVADALLEVGENTAIAEKLSLSLSAVNWHMKNIASRLGAPNRVVAAVTYDRWKRSEPSGSR